MPGKKTDKPKYPPQNEIEGCIKLETRHCPRELRDLLRLKSIKKGRHLWEHVMVLLAESEDYELPVSVQRQFKGNNHD